MLNLGRNSALLTVSKSIEGARESQVIHIASSAVDYASIPADLYITRWYTMVHPAIQTQAFKRLLYLWPEKAIRILYNNYYDTLTYITQRHTHDIHKAEDIVQYTLAELWFRHRENRFDRYKSVQHYLVSTVKQRGRKAFEPRMAWYIKNGLESEIQLDNTPDDDDARFIVENPPTPYDKFGFDQSRYRYWNKVEYIFYPWKRLRRMFFDALRNFMVGSVVAVFVGCLYYLFR